MPGLFSGPDGTTPPAVQHGARPTVRWVAAKDFDAAGRSPAGVTGCQGALVAALAEAPADVVGADIERRQMSVGLVGRKCGMTRIFRKPATLFRSPSSEALPNRVTTVKTAERDGYSAVQVTVGAAPRRTARRRPKPATSRARRSTRAAASMNSASARRGGAELKAGAELKVDLFKVGQYVDVSGTTQGQGLLGRHQAAPLLPPVHVARQLAVAPCAGRHRPASNAGPRVPGKRMAGRLGADNVTPRPISRSSRSTPSATVARQRARSRAARTAES